MFKFRVFRIWVYLSEFYFVAVRLDLIRSHVVAAQIWLLRDSLEGVVCVHLSLMLIELLNSCALILVGFIFMSVQAYSTKTVS